MDSRHASINVTFSCFLSYTLFIILRYIEWLIICSIIGIFFIFYSPFPFFFLNLLLSEWIVFLGNCFIVSKRRDRSRKEFSPFTSFLHVGDNLCTELFVFMLTIYGIEYDIISLLYTTRTK